MVRFKMPGSRTRSKRGAESERDAATTTSLVNDELIDLDGYDELESGLDAMQYDDDKADTATDSSQNIYTPVPGAGAIIMHTSSPPDSFTGSRAGSWSTLKGLSRDKGSLDDLEFNNALENLEGEVGRLDDVLVRAEYYAKPNGTSGADTIRALTKYDKAALTTLGTPTRRPSEMERKRRVMLAAAKAHALHDELRIGGRDMGGSDIAESALADEAAC